MKPISRFYLSLALLIFLSLSGCGGGSTQPMPQVQGAQPPFMSGLYQIFGSSNSNLFTLSGSLMQNGSNVSGVMHIGMPACFSFNTDLPVSGTLTNDANLTVTLSLTLPNGQMLSFSLTHPGGHLSTVAGNFSITGAGCAAAEQGLANGGIVTITGLWQGTLITSAQTVSSISLNLTQTGPDAHGFFSATGTGTITGGTCFGSVTVDPATVIGGIGTNLVLNNSQAGTTGKVLMSGTVIPGSFGSTSFEGPYTSMQGACSEIGTARLQVG